MDIVDWLRELKMSTANADWNATIVNNRLDEAADEIEKLRKALKKSQDDMKWWITQTEMRGITFARVTLEGGGGD